MGEAPYHQAITLSELKFAADACNAARQTGRPLESASVQRGGCKKKEIIGICNAARGRVLWCGKLDGNPARPGDGQGRCAEFHIKEIARHALGPMPGGTYRLYYAGALITEN